MSQTAVGWDLPLGGAPELLAIGSATSSLRGKTTSYELWLFRHDAAVAVARQTWQVVPGSVVLLAPGVDYQVQRAPQLVARFALRVSGETSRVLAHHDLGRSCNAFVERFEQAQHAFSARPAQAAARLWDILWELAERSSRSEPRQGRRHSALDSACRVIHSRLSERLSLSDLATPAGVSPAHLTRLFRAELGLTATDYLRRCRLERALHLLTRSEVPVKEVACEVGIPDLHAFNKIVRRGYGVSPRELRLRGQPALDQDLGHELVRHVTRAHPEARHVEPEVLVQDREVDVS
jgi:AraC family transcriptional regulator